MSVGDPIAPWERAKDAVREWWDARRGDAEEWCAEDRTPWPRLALLAYLFYAGIRHVASPLYRSWFAGITLAFHEMGHIVFAAPRMLQVAGGSIMQLLVPLAAALYLLHRQRDYFGFAVGSAWLSFSMWELATYVGDASTEALPLVGFSDNPEHDWSTLLTAWGVLNHDTEIATAVRAFAFLAWAGSIALGAWLCWRMWRARKASV